jgi:hypothetical protein
MGCFTGTSDNCNKPVKCKYRNTNVSHTVYAYMTGISFILSISYSYVYKNI